MTSIKEPCPTTSHTHVCPIGKCYAPKSTPPVRNTINIRSDWHLWEKGKKLESKHKNKCLSMFVILEVFYFHIFWCQIFLWKALISHAETVSLSHFMNLYGKNLLFEAVATRRSSFLLNCAKFAQQTTTFSKKKILLFLHFSSAV